MGFEIINSSHMYLYSIYFAHMLDLPTTPHLRMYDYETIIILWTSVLAYFPSSSLIKTSKVL
jgi:hypothetical protein